MRQGRPLSPDVEMRCVKLLRETDLSCRAIGERLGLSSTGVLIVNRRHQVREYYRGHQFVLISEKAAS